MGRSTVQWTVSLPPSLSKKALAAAKNEDRTKSEFVRESIRQYLERRALEGVRNRLSRRFAAMGIRTEADVERMIDEGRQ